MNTTVTLKKGSLVGIIVLAVILSLLIGGLAMFIKNNQAWKQAKVTFSEMTISMHNLQNEVDSLELDLGNAKAEIAQQKTTLEERDAKIAILEARPTSGSGISRGELTARDRHIASLEKALDECFKSKANVSSTPATTPTPAFVAPAAETVAKPAATKATNLTAVNTRLPDAYWENGKIAFCVRLGGNSNRHLPHLAMRKTDFSDAMSNGIGGFNWYLSQPTNDLVGDYGCTVDGTFFVSAALINQYLVKADGEIVEIFAKAFGWSAKKMTKFGDYYISEK